MTLAPNHLPLLNGNKILIFFILISSISSCASKKITSSTHKETIEVGDKKKNRDKTIDLVEINIKPSVKEDSVLVSPETFDIIQDKSAPKTENSTSTNTPTNTTKITYNVAVILPFNLSQIPLGKYVDDSTKQLSTDSKNAVEFYLGCQMAKEQFESKKLQANVYFLDDNNDSLTTAMLFNAKPFPDIDYIIGPANYKNLTLIANKAKAMQIPLISPFANSMYIKDNPFLFNANASLWNQYSWLLSHTQNEFKGKTTEVLYDGKDLSAENISIFKEIAQNASIHNAIKYHAISATDDALKMLSQADTLSERVFIIYSSKENYIKSIIPKLKPIKNHLQIFTSNAAFNPKLFNGLKTPHSIWSVSPYNKTNLNYNIFNQRFEEKYLKKPTEVAHQAFDILMHLLNTIDSNVSLFTNSNSGKLDFDNTQTKFQFKPVTDNAGNINYYDNTYLNLYELKNGNFSLIEK